MTKQGSPVAVVAVGALQVAGVLAAMVVLAIPGAVLVLLAFCLVVPHVIDAHLHAAQEAESMASAAGNLRMSDCT